MKKFFIKTFGCQMNVNDSEKIRYILKQRLMESVESESEADIVIINSCAVREKAQEKIFSYIGRLGTEQIVIVAGCVAQSEKKELLRKNRRINYVVGTHQYYSIASIVDGILQKNERDVKTDFSRGWEEVLPDVDSRDDGVSGFISIMEGCNNFCSYCIVPYTRSREKSRPLDSIIKEVNMLSEAGYKEVILIGQNVNSWRDEEEGLEFADLLAKVAEISDAKWIRFITSYPGYYNKKLIDVMLKHRNIARHIHFPAQSGSTRVLKKMNRIYNRSEYLNIINSFKKKMPDISFSSDFIVGFPGETENDFRLTLSLIDKVEYDSIFSFIYSKRKYTKAAEMPDKVTAENKKKRLYELQDLQKSIQLRNNKQLVGKELDVLITGNNPKIEGEVIGRTETYRVVNFKSSAEAGDLVKVRIDRAGPYSLRGTQIS